MIIQYDVWVPPNQGFAAYQVFDNICYVLKEKHNTPYAPVTLVQGELYNGVYQIEIEE